jgi:hypothetical protein
MGILLDRIGETARKKVLRVLGRRTGGVERKVI